MRHIAVRRPGTGACTLASAMELWLWTLQHLQHATDADGERLYQTVAAGRDVPARRRPVLAARLALPDPRRVGTRGRGPGNARRWRTGCRARAVLLDLAHVQAARAAGEVGRIAAELVHGYNRHPAWDAEGCACCYGEADLASLEQLIPGIESTAGSLRRHHPVERSLRGEGGPVRPLQGSRRFRSAARAGSTAASPARAWPRTARPRR